MVAIGRTGSASRSCTWRSQFLLLAALGLTWSAWRSLGSAFGIYSLPYWPSCSRFRQTTAPTSACSRISRCCSPWPGVMLDRPLERQKLLYAFAAVGAPAAYGFLVTHSRTDIE